MKKFLNITLILVLTIFILSGCAKQPGTTVIKFSSWGSKSELSVLKPLLAEFKKQNPDIAVEFIHIPKNYFQKLHLLFASNLAPDVVFINNINGKIYIENDKLLPLNDFLKTDKDLKEKDFFKKSLEAFEYKEAVYAVPRDISNLVVYYNKDIFDKYGVEYPNKNWSFEKFLLTAQKLTKDTNGDKVTDIYGFGFEENPLFWLPFLWSNGGGIINQDLSKISLSDPASINSIQFYSDLRNKYHVSPQKDVQASATTSQLFLDGKIAMHISGKWNVPLYRENATCNWDIMSFPQGSKGSIVDVDSSGWAISKQSKNAEAAWKLIKFLASQKSIQEFTKDGLIVPSRIDVANSKIFLEGKPKNSQIFTEIISMAIPTPSNSNYQEMLDLINEALEPVFLGKQTAKQAITPELNRQLKELLD